MNHSKQRRSVGSDRVTIRDVADRVGFCTATVSNALANKPYVTAATRALVLKAAKELGYVKSPIAQALRTGKTNVIGLVFSNLANPFYPEILAGISQVLTPAGYQTIICNTELEPIRQTQHIENLIRRSVDGIILLSQSDCAEDVAAIQHAKIPLVTLWRVSDSKEVAFVGIDEEAGMRAALDHLWALNHRSIALIRGTKGAGKERAFRAFMKKKKRKIPAGNIISCVASLDGGRDAAQHLLMLPEVPTAVVATSDIAALGAIVALTEAGLTVPDDISVVGFDDTYVASLPQVSLSCVSPPRLEWGLQAGQAMLRQITNPRGPAEQTVLQFGFSVRSTTSAARQYEITFPSA